MRRVAGRERAAWGQVAHGWGLARRLVFVDGDGDPAPKGLDPIAAAAVAEVGVDGQVGEVDVVVRLVFVEAVDEIVDVEVAAPVEGAAVGVVDYGERGVVLFFFIIVVVAVVDALQVI